MIYSFYYIHPSTDSQQHTTVPIAVTHNLVYTVYNDSFFSSKIQINY